VTQIYEFVEVPLVCCFFGSEGGAIAIVLQRNIFENKK